MFLLSKIDSIGRITPLSFHAETTQLGKSVKKTGVISKKSQLRTVSIIKKYIIDADKYYVVGTSALREAKNRNEFIRLLYKETGQKIRILTEQEEADLVFKSVNYFLKPIPKKTIICDIGGGSTEFIFCINGRPKNKISIPIGAVNLTERFGSNLQEMEITIKRLLQNYTNYRLIGVGGTVTTLGAILKRLKKYDPRKVHKYIVPFDKVVITLNKLKSISLNERKKIISFDPKRADIILAGLCILKTIMETFNIGKIKICDRGLVWGLAVNYSK